MKGLKGWKGGLAFFHIYFKDYCAFVVSDFGAGFFYPPVGDHADAAEVAFVAVRPLAHVDGVVADVVDGDAYFVHWVNLFFSLI